MIKDNYTDQKLNTDITTGTAYEVMLNTDIELNKISHHSFGYEELGEAAPGTANVRQQSSKELLEKNESSHSKEQFNSQAQSSNPF